MVLIGVLIYLFSFRVSATFTFNSSDVQRIAPHENKHCSLGAAVAMSNDIALVSAPCYSHSVFEKNTGKVFVYGRDDSLWTLFRTITDMEYNNEFGANLAIHTDYFAVIGAPMSNKFARKAGCVYYVFIEPSPHGKQEEPVSLIQSEQHENAQFGAHVGVGVVNGEVIAAIGAPGHRDRGAIFVYARQQDGTLSNEEILYESIVVSGFGQSVDVGYGLIAAGSQGGSQSNVYIFERLTHSGFTQTAVLTEKELRSDNSLDNDNNNQYGHKEVKVVGSCINIGEDFLFVGISYDSTSADQASNYGRVIVYSYEVNSSSSYSAHLFDYVQAIEPSHLSSDGIYSYFGTSIDYSDSEKRLVVGSPYTSNGNGSATLYVWNSVDQNFELDVVLSVDEQYSGDTASAKFGQSVAITNRFMLVGAPQGDDFFGVAYIFTGNEVSEAMSFYELISSHMVRSFSIILFPVVIVAVVLMLVMWRKYRKSHDDDEDADSCCCLRAESGTIDFSDDDSSHSSHPMIVSVTPKKKKSSAKKGKMSKLSSKRSAPYLSAICFDDDDYDDKL